MCLGVYNVTNLPINGTKCHTPINTPRTANNKRIKLRTTHGNIHPDLPFEYVKKTENIIQQHSGAKSNSMYTYVLDSQQ